MQAIALTLTFLTLTIIGHGGLTVAASTIQPRTCSESRNQTLICINEELTTLHSAAASIHGTLNATLLCDPAVTEQTCYLCRLFNRTQHCLDIMFDGCSYAEFHDFIHGPKFPYLASLASLCNYQNVINEINENRECYNRITANLRQCFNILDRVRTCSEVNKGFSCANKISQAFCARLFEQKGHHRYLSELYLRALEPSIDMQNCTEDSRQVLATIYPDYQYRWKRPTTTNQEVRTKSEEPLENQTEPEEPPESETLSVVITAEVFPYNSASELVGGTWLYLAVLCFKLLYQVDCNL